MVYNLIIRVMKMKVLFKKFRRSSLKMRLVYLFTLFVFIGSYIFIFLSLLKLEGIETTLRIVGLSTLGFILFLYLFYDLIFLITKHHITLAISSIVVLIISAACINAGLAVNKVYDLVDNMVIKENDLVKYTTNLIVLKDTKYENKKTFKVGMIDNKTDTEGYVLPKELIKRDKLEFTVTEYDTYLEMLELLYAKKLDGVFITSDFEAIYNSTETFENIGDDVRVAVEYSKEMKNQNYIASTGSVDKPFTLLIMGVDSKAEKLNPNAGFNGDTLMLITFNPNTLNATVFSIPRDTYVPIACLKNQSGSKINSSAGHGTNCVINTIQNLTGIKIDYFVKINFKGVVNLVNALGGIEVDTEKPDYTKNGKHDCNGMICEQDSNREWRSHTVYVPVGKNVKLNGEQALAYARNRHQWAASDFKRIEHQQAVVNAIANKAKSISTVNDFYKVLEAISQNIYTNMATKEMLNLYNVGKQILSSNSDDSFGINIQRTYLSGYSFMMIIGNMKSRVYTYQYYEQSLAEIVDAMKVNLGQKSPTVIKTFSFSANTDYKQKVIGKGYYSQDKLKTVADFKTMTVTQAQTWCTQYGLTCTVSYVVKGQELYDETLKEGTIVDQSVRHGVLTTKVTGPITLYVIKKSTVTTPITQNTIPTSDKTSESTSESTSDNTSESTSEKTSESTTEKTTEPSSGDQNPENG